MSETYERIADGTSRDGFSAAVHDAVEKMVPGDEKPGLRFDVTEMWIETIEHHSPWHITYNVKIAPEGGG
jgi:hypothetical protein